MTESFNGKFRNECLSVEWFRSMAEAKVEIESWRRHYNDVWPHSSLGNLTLTAFRLLGEKPAIAETILRNEWHEKAAKVSCEDGF